MPRGQHIGKGRSVLCGFLAAAGTVLLVLAFLISVIETAAFDPAYYDREYEKNETALYVGVTDDTLSEATYNLLAYLRGQRDSLNMQAEVDGEQREYYNEREKLHMEDVRDLNLGALNFMWTGYLLGGVLVISAFALSKKKYQVWGAVFWSILGVLAAFAAIGLWGAADFSSFWVSFHHVFFSNDLWLFDPRQSLLIRMFEEQFFFDLVGEILAWFLSVTAVALVVSGVLYRRGRKRGR